LVFGIVLTGAGVMLMMDRFGMTDIRELARFWPVILILFGASLVSQAFQGVSMCGRREAAADGTPRPERADRRGGGFGLILLLVIGALFFSQTVQRLQPRVIADRLQEPGAASLKVFAVMGEDHRQSFATDFDGAEMTTVMGQSRLDLRDAILSPGQEAVVEVFGMMGEVQLIVPDGWIVEIRTRPIMGAVRDLRFNRNRVMGPPAPGDDSEETTAPAKPLNPPRVVVRGFIMMGELEIRSS
jgi:hypothetical protein